jgi:hypothetical protein
VTGAVGRNPNTTLRGNGDPVRDAFGIAAANADSAFAPIPTRAVFTYIKIARISEFLAGIPQPKDRARIR